MRNLKQVIVPPVKTKFEKDKIQRKAVHVGTAILNGTLRVVNSSLLDVGAGDGSLDNEPDFVRDHGIINDYSPLSEKSEGEA